MATEKPRFSITVSDDVYQQINDYQHEHRLPTQTKAVLAFIEKGLEVIQNEKKPLTRIIEVEEIDIKSKGHEQVTQYEMAHINKYRLLDDYGKEAVDGVLDVEYRRCETEKQEAERQARAAAVREQKRRMEAGEEIAPEGGRVIDLPFDELKASAGTGYELDYDRLIPWKVLYNEMTRKADFCLEVDGRSMEPVIHDGDIILVRQQPAVDKGEIGLFTVGDKGYVKKQGEHELISVNDEFENIIPSEYGTFFCRGKVVGVLDPDWIVER